LLDQPSSRSARTTSSRTIAATSRARVGSIVGVALCGAGAQAMTGRGAALGRRPNCSAIGTARSAARPRPALARAARSGGSARVG